MNNEGVGSKEPVEPNHWKETDSQISEGMGV